METLFLLLTTSVLFNLLLFRWGVRERSARKMWQQEAAALQHALRHPRDRGPFHLRNTNLGLLLVGGLFFVFFVLAVLSL